MQIRLLGAFQLAVSTGTIAVQRRRERCALAVLLVNNGHPISIDRLAHLLWDGSPPATARQQVHSHASRLRGLLRGAAVQLERDGDRYRIEVDPAVVDVARFLTAVSAARADLPGRQELLRSALKLWTGEPLEGTASPWLRQQLFGELQEVRMSAAEEWLSGVLAAGEAVEAIPQIERLFDIAPDREALLELLMRAYQQAGRPADALRAYERYRQRLAREFGVAPRPTVQQLHRDLAGAAESRPAVDGKAAIRPAQLPASAAVFVGRREALGRLDAVSTSDIDDAADLPASGTIIRITGMGGVGKTALAVRWAHSAAHRFPDGCLFADLRGFSPGPPAEPADILLGFLQGLGIVGDGLPVGVQALAGKFRSIVADRRMLVILDNASDLSQLRPLLPAAPGSVAIVTSRNALPELAVLYDSPVVRLGRLDDVEAHAVLKRLLPPDQADTARVGRIAAACGNLPIALRIVAARVGEAGTLDVDDLLDQLESPGRVEVLQVGDAPELALAATFDQSYQALSGDAQRLLKLIAAAPLTVLGRAAITAMSGSTPADADRLLEQLSRAHLADAVGRQFQLHDLVRAYVQGLARPEDTAGRRLIDHYATAAEDCAVYLNPPTRSAMPRRRETSTIRSRAEAQAWCDTEWQQAVALVRYADDRDWHQDTIRMVVAVWQYLQERELVDDLVDTHLRALRAGIAVGDQPIVQAIRRYLSHGEWLSGRRSAAVEYLRQALQRYLACEDPIMAVEVRSIINGIGPRQPSLR